MPVRHMAVLWKLPQPVLTFIMPFTELSVKAHRVPVRCPLIVPSMAESSGISRKGQRMKYLYPSSDRGMVTSRNPHPAVHIRDRFPEVFCSDVCMIAHVRKCCLRKKRCRLIPFVFHFMQIKTPQKGVPEESGVDVLSTSLRM